MAGLLNMARADWWQIDKVFFIYFGAITALDLIFWSRLPDPLLLILSHLGGALLIALATRSASPVFHYWYPLPYVFACYKEMSILIPALRRTEADAALARIDFAVWGANPTVWLERLRSPMLAELLEIVYSGFVPAVLLVAV